MKMMNEIRKRFDSINSRNAKVETNKEHIEFWQNRSYSLLR